MEAKRTVRVHTREEAAAAPGFILVAAASAEEDFYKTCQGEPGVVACREGTSSKITGTTARSRSFEQLGRGVEVAAGLGAEADAGWWNVSLRRLRPTMLLLPMAVAAQVSLNSPTKPVSCCLVRVVVDMVRVSWNRIEMQ